MFLLQPAYKDYLWGGSRLRTEYGKNSPNTIIAESWELSVHPDGRSVIASGADAGRTLADYLAEHPKAAGGAKGEQFPVLAKLIDANAVEQAAKSGDGEALRSLLSSMLSTQEGKRLAESVRRMMEN